MQIVPVNTLKNLNLFMLKTFNQSHREFPFWKWKNLQPALKISENSRYQNTTSQWNKITQQKKPSMILYVLCECYAQPNRYWMGNYSAYFFYAKCWPKI